MKLSLLVRSFSFHSLEVLALDFHLPFIQEVFVIFANLVVFYLQAKLLVQELLTFHTMLHSSF